MWVICLSAEQSADKELIQRISRSLKQVMADRPVLLIRFPFQLNKEVQSLETISSGRFLSSHLNEAGIAVVNIEGTDRELLRVDDGVLKSNSMTWVANLLKQGILVSLSLTATDQNQLVCASLEGIVSVLTEAKLEIDALIFINKELKRRISVDGEPVSTLKLGHSALNSRVLDENVIDDLPKLSNTKVYITSPIALLSKTLDKSTLIAFS